VGDPGYFNRWTLEIEDHSLVPTVLKVGEKVGQMVFMRTGDVSGAPAPRALKGLEPYTVKGQYQKTSDLETLIQEWSPLCMIPSKAVTYLRTQGSLLRVMTFVRGANGHLCLQTVPVDEVPLGTFRSAERSQIPQM